MTERISGLVVTLEDDIREDDAASLMAAIVRLRGVIDVRPVTARPGVEFVVRQRVKAKVRDTLLAALNAGDDE